MVADEIDLCDPDFYDRALPILARGEADMVVGSKRARRLGGRPAGLPAPRHLGPQHPPRASSLGFHGTDTHGVKAFSRERIAPVASRCVVDRDVFASELVLRAGLEGKRVVEIPIELHEKRAALHRPAAARPQRAPAGRPPVLGAARQRPGPRRVGARESAKRPPA